MGNVALYYPYIHFRSETWLKMTALYWPRIGRMVPWHYPVRDSVGVQMLRDELDLIHDLDPEPVVQEVSDHFLQLIEAHEDVIRARCDVSSLLHGQAPDLGGEYPRSFASDRIAYIYASKVSHSLREALAGRSLAVDSRGHSWVGVHPDLARVYMCAVAERLGALYTAHPATDTPGAFAATGSGSLERITRVLWEEPSVGAAGLAVPSGRGGGSALTEVGIESAAMYDRFMVAALQMVVPQNISKIPMERIIEARQRSWPLFAGFRSHVETYVDELTAAQASPDARVLTSEIAAQLELSLEPKLRELERELRSAKVDTFRSLWAVKTVVPSGSLAAAAVAATGIPTWSAGAAAAAAASCLVVHDTNDRRAGVLQESPAGYLYSVRRQLTASRGLRSLLRRITM